MPTVLEEIGERGKLNYLVCLQRYRGAGEDWSGEIETTLEATWRLIESLTSGFVDSEDNAITLVSSAAGRSVIAEQPLSYHVAKAGLEQMVRYYGVSLGPKGIRTNGVAPCTILKKESEVFYLNNDRLHKLYRNVTPLGRMGTSNEVAQVISFLCSSKSSFITGQTIVVDGGSSLLHQESLAHRFSHSSSEDVLTL